MKKNIMEDFEIIYFLKRFTNMYIYNNWNKILTLMELF